MWLPYRFSLLTIFEDTLAKQQKMFRLEEQMVNQITLFSKVFNQSDTAFVVQAVFERVRRVAQEEALDWQQYTQHDLIDGGFECALFVLEGLAWDEKESRTRKFVLEHAPFFYSNPHEPQRQWMPQHRRLPVLWPELDAYMRVWAPRDRPYAAGHAMQDALQAVSEPDIPTWGGRTIVTDEIDSPRVKANQRRRTV